MKHLNRPFVCLGVVAAVCFPSILNGGIISVSGSIDTSNFSLQGTAGFTNFGVNVVENNSAIQLFEERQDFTLSSALTLDSLGGASTTSAGALPGLMPVGTKVDSYLFHYDPTTGGPLTGTVEFDAPIIGLVYDNFTNFGSSPILETSDFLAKPGTTMFYSNSRRGIIFGEVGDSWSIAADGRTLTTSLTVSSTSTDNLRVLTAATAIPEPSSLALLGIGAIGMAVVARRRRKKQAVV